MGCEACQGTGHSAGGADVGAGVADVSSDTLTMGILHFPQARPAISMVRSVMVDLT